MGACSSALNKAKDEMEGVKDDPAQQQQLKDEADKLKERFADPEWFKAEEKFMSQFLSKDYQGAMKTLKDGLDLKLKDPSKNQKEIG